MTTETFLRVTQTSALGNHSTSVRCGKDTCWHHGSVHDQEVVPRALHFIVGLLPGRSVPDLVKSGSRNPGCQSCSGDNNSCNGPM